MLPTAAVTAENVRFANVTGGARPDMVRLKGIEAELKIWPLLRGSVEVDRFVLIEPEFNLEIDAEGRANWALGAPRRRPRRDRAGGGGTARGRQACVCRSPS